MNGNLSALMPIVVIDAIGAVLLALGLVERFAQLGLLPPIAWLPEAMIAIGVALTVVSSGLLLRRIAAAQRARG